MKEKKEAFMINDKRYLLHIDNHSPQMMSNIND